MRIALLERIEQLIKTAVPSLSCASPPDLSSSSLESIPASDASSGSKQPSLSPAAMKSVLVLLLVALVTLAGTQVRAAPQDVKAEQSQGVSVSGAGPGANINVNQDQGAKFSKG